MQGLGDGRCFPKDGLLGAPTGVILSPVNREENSQRGFSSAHLIFHAQQVVEFWGFGDIRASHDWEAFVP